MLGYRADVVKEMPITCPRRGDRAQTVRSSKTGISSRLPRKKKEKKNEEINNDAVAPVLRKQTGESSRLISKISHEPRRAVLQ